MAVKKHRDAHGTYINSMPKTLPACFRYRDHLLTACKQFLATETYRSEVVQRQLQEMKSKVAKKARV